MAPAVLPTPRGPAHEEKLMDDRSVNPAVRAGDPFAAEAGAKQAKRSHRRTEAELVEAIAEEEVRRGYPMTPRERDGFAWGFFSVEYKRDVREWMRGMGIASEEYGEEA